MVTGPTIIKPYQSIPLGMLNLHASLWKKSQLQFQVGFWEIGLENATVGLKLNYFQPVSILPGGHGC